MSFERITRPAVGVVAIGVVAASIAFPEVIGGSWLVHAGHSIAGF
jgi:hypothetical protein